MAGLDRGLLQGGLAIRERCSRIAGTCNAPPITVVSATRGAVAQLGERSVRNAEVEGSIPFGSTNDEEFELAAGWAAFIFPAQTLQPEVENPPQVIRTRNVRRLVVPFPGQNSARLNGSSSGPGTLNGRRPKRTSLRPDTMQEKYNSCKRKRNTLFWRRNVTPEHDVSSSIR